MPRVTLLSMDRSLNVGRWLMDEAKTKIQNKIQQRDMPKAKCFDYEFQQPQALARVLHIYHFAFS